MKTATKVAWLFPGQGSQEIGMGRALFNAYPQADQIFEHAEKLTGLPLKTISQRGPESTLILTDHLQPTLVALSIAYVDFLKSNGKRPTITAGHSLGELSALYAAEVLSMQDVLLLAAERGRLMAASAEGGMMAVKDLACEEVEEVLRISGTGVLVAANFNAPEQLVISGENDSLDAIAPILSARGGKCIRLQVQGAWHSPLVHSAAETFRDTIDRVTFQAPTCKVVMGMTAEYVENPDQIREMLKSQICSPVRWFEVMQKISSEGIKTFIEVGPGKVLKGLMRKIFEKADDYEFVGVDNSRFIKEIQSNGAGIEC